MSRPRRRRPLLWGLLLLIALPLCASTWVWAKAQGRIFSAQQVGEAPVALVFGAGLSAVEKPSPVLKERLDAAMALYKSGKVKKLLMSGDNSERSHDETKAMRRYAIDRGLPSSDVVGDYAGFSTYESLYRAREIFGADRLILVTQRYHLPRALYLAQALGLEAVGVAADERRGEWLHVEPREILARVAALWDAWNQPTPRILGKSENALVEGVSEHDAGRP